MTRLLLNLRFAPIPASLALFAMALVSTGGR